MKVKILLMLFAPILAIGQGRVAPFSQEMKDSLCNKVKAAAQHAWKGYQEHASGYDDLQPLTNTGKNWYNTPVLMTPVDAYDTFIMLGLKKEAEEAKQMIVSTLTFDIDAEVQVFEVTIRLLGGLISAYELDKDARFLALAKDLGNRMYPVFNTSTGMPYRYIHLRTGKLRDSVNNPAEIGSLLLEFGKLSCLTGDPKFFRAAKKAILAVYNKRSKLDLVGEKINVNTGKWVSTHSHIGGYIDSYYEYLYKGWKLFGDRDLKKAFDKHQLAVQKYLADSTDYGLFYRRVDMNSGKETGTIYGALDAFYAGLSAYAGDIETARQNQQANMHMWVRFNMEPESFNYKTEEIENAVYLLRPENIESCFYLFRATQHYDYLWMGKLMFEDILAHCKTETAFAALRDIRTFEKMNSMESFFFAETLKYAYLLFADEKEADLSKIVFNTEAHPLIIESKGK